MKVTEQQKLEFLPGILLVPSQLLLNLLVYPSLFFRLLRQTAGHRAKTSSHPELGEEKLMLGSSPILALERVANKKAPDCCVDIQVLPFHL